ncbi:MAG: carboxymuconolactone decarboxylase family protein [Chloroflexi bacterium]|nr:carboxymuconolactone decarboxylase family protein [Chloroflexota bacterium]
MPRVPAITRREDLPPEHQPRFDAIAQSRGGRIAGPFKVLLNSPEVAARAAHLGAYLRFESSLRPDLRELAILNAARENDCQYEFTAHVPLARQQGVREEAITAIAERRAPEGLTPEEAIITRYAQEIVRQRRVSEETFQAALAHLGTRGVTELTALLGYYTMLAFALNAFQVELEPGAAPLMPE